MPIQFICSRCGGHATIPSFGTRSFDIIGTCSDCQEEDRQKAARSSGDVRPDGLSAGLHAPAPAEGQGELRRTDDALMAAKSAYEKSRGRDSFRVWEKAWKDWSRARNLIGPVPLIQEPLPQISKELADEINTEFERRFPSQGEERVIASGHRIDEAGISDYGMSFRLEKRISGLGCETFEELCERFTPSELLMIEGLGRVSLRELVSYLHSIGLAQLEYPYWESRKSRGES